MAEDTIYDDSTGLLYDGDSFYDGGAPIPPPDIESFSYEFFTTQDQLYRKFKDAAGLSADIVAKSLSTIRGSSAILPVDYSNFAEHVYFNNAERKTQSAITKLVNTYPVGISGSTTAGLSSNIVAEVDAYITQLNGFEKYVLDYLGGASGNYYLNPVPSITAAASGAVSSSLISLVHLKRNTTNTLTGVQVTLSSTLLSLAQAFDAGMNTVYMISGTGDHDVKYFDDGSIITSRELPETRIEYVNRQASIENWMPDALLSSDTEENLPRFVSTVGSIFDDIKLYINEFANITHINYDDYHRVPDGEIMPLVAKHFGFDLIDTLLRQDISKYLRREEDTLPLYKVSYKIWNRVLNNLIYLYKKKGTLEAVKSLIRIYGLPPEYMQINDYSFNSEPFVQQKVDYKNVRALAFNVGAVTQADMLVFSNSLSSQLGIKSNSGWYWEARVKMTDFSSTQVLYNFGLHTGTNKGTILYYDSSGDKIVWRANDGTTVIAPEISFTAYPEVKEAISTQLVSIFTSQEGLSGSKLAIGWVSEDSGSATTYFYCSTALTANAVSSNSNFYIGASANGSAFFRGYMHEMKMADFGLNIDDMNEHVRNYESVSFMKTLPNWSSNKNMVRFSNVLGQWKMKENLVLSGWWIQNAWTLKPSLTASASGSLTSNNRYTMFEFERKETNITAIGDFADDNVDLYISETSKPRKSNILNIGFNPVQAINTDIINVYGSLDVPSLMGDPINFYGPLSGSFTYQTMSATASELFGRYNNTELNFNAYIEVLQNLSPIIEGIFSGIEQLVPARVKFINRGLTIEPHLLESVRYQTPASKFEPELIPEDVIYRTETFKTEDCVLVAAPMTREETLSGDADSTRDYNLVTFEQLEYLQNNWTMNIPRIEGNFEVQPFEQKVYWPANTGIFVEVNRNFISSRSDLNDWTTTLTGSIQLVRASTYKRIASQENCLRIYPPRRTEGRIDDKEEELQYFNFYVRDLSTMAERMIAPTARYADFKIPSKNGLVFRLERKEAYLDEKIGTLQIKFTNLLSGDSGEIAIIYAPNEADIAGTVEITTEAKVFGPKYTETEKATVSRAMKKGLANATTD